MRPFRFGVEASDSYDRLAWRSLSRDVADLGYASLLVIDHAGDQLAPLPAMMAAADAAPGLRVGSFVLAEGLRHPAVLAREAATVDRLTDGRVELGLGAGWRRTDYDRLGLLFPSGAERVERLAEALAIVKALLSGGRVSITGRHYTVHDLDGLPAPAQRPHPPILVGGGGRQVLTLAAREADIVGLNPVHTATEGVPTDLTAAATRRKVGWIRAAAGERLDRVELNIRAYRTVVARDWRAAADGVAAEMRLPVEEVLASPHLLVGDIERLVDALERHRAEFGVSYVVVTADAYRVFAPVVARMSGR
ncbi:TIGR03621 family F420-dependent LLM class oxidoreductase [Phytohabitans rumicis]|uniref:LLM class F420-dependent oxidoreductase n=1 Tax=Phytohabitans rumicis TaxID=1076125 RepID=A0A6V8LNA5_9ACTN|nr:TIGR03621 family F420-dependent LLM class oxidoreductase [Phytohabitans rumicis]GFJ95557.1 LLM class F420-dependent oxidoreductase [Phytohabitans rumicis]